MKNLKITIPEPCHKDWSKMSNTEKGKFCNYCIKEIFDFTSFSDEQLIKHFEKEGDLCGRFTTNQLDRSLVLQRKKQYNYLSYAFSGIFSLLLLNTTPVKAQGKPKTIQTDKKFVSIPLQNTSVKDSITISGTILDETNYPLPGAIIIVKGTTVGTSTDYDGKFNIECKKTDTLNISYIGYQDVLHKVIENSNTNIKLVLEEEVLGEMITVYGKKRWIGGNIFTRITNIFRKHNKNPKLSYKEQ